MSTVKVSSVQLPIQEYESLEDWREHMERYVWEANDNGSKLILFPEYGSMSLVSLFQEYLNISLEDLSEEEKKEHIKRMTISIQEFLPYYRETFQYLAQKYKMVIVAGSFPVIENGEMYNRAYVYGPDGEMMGHQDKMILTSYEREYTSLKAGKCIESFYARGIGRFSIAICFDSEYPVLVKRMVDEKEAQLILVPSCTDSERGYDRVRTGCKARALENYVPVVSSVTVGEAPWSMLADINYGSAALYGPSDGGFPPGGVITEGKLNKPDLVHMKINFETFEHARKHGYARNFSYWEEQFTPELC